MIKKAAAGLCRLVVVPRDCSAGKEQNLRLRDVGGELGSIWLGQCPCLSC